MKKSYWLSVVLVMSVLLTGCDTVTAGHEGIKVNLLGTEKGVQVETLPVGRYWIGLNEELFIFPTFTQNYVWTRDRAEGSTNDESITFQTKEGLSVNADIGIAYHIKSGMTSTVFQKYRRGVDEITDIFLRNGVRDALVSQAGSLSITSVSGAGKNDLIKHAQEQLQKDVIDIGIIIEKLYWVGSLRLPAIVKQSIGAKIAASQKAILRQNEIAQSKAEADKKIEEAKGEAESVRINAQAEAAAINIVGQALSNNPRLIELEKVKKWNGVLPRMTGDVVPFINIKNND